MTAATEIRALIAEDDYFVAEEISERLREAGYQIAGIARDGVEAVNLTRSLHPDVVLMDIKMPHMDGLKASREIQERCPAPVVILTAYGDAELAREGATSGVGAYLVKPPITAQLNHAIMIARARFADMHQLRRLNAELHRQMVECQQALEARRHCEERTRQTEKLQSLAIMASGIAHDYNNLLQAIHGYIELAMLEAPAESKELRYLAEANIATRRAAHISSMMLAYVGHGKRDFDVLSLGELIEGMKEALDGVVAGNASLSISLAPGLPHITGDSSQMQQVVVSLVANASEALEGKAGIINVSVGSMYCSQAWLSETYADDHLPEGQYVCLKVSDTGCGIPPQIFGSIFDPFFSTKFTGRGMGLAATLGIIRGHKGAIKVESEAGKGALFTVVFPAILPQ